MVKIMKKHKIITHPIKNKIVVSTANIAKDELICEGRVTGIATAWDNHSLQMSENQHVYMDEPAELFSHSCQRNVYIKNNEFEGV